MWLLRGIVIMVVVALFLWFAIQNAAEKVSLNFPDGRTASDIPVIFALLVAFIAGMFAWFLFSLFHDIRLRQDLRRSRKENQRLREELKALRNLPMQDIEESGDVLETEEQQQLS